MKLISNNKFDRFIEVFTDDDPPPPGYNIAPKKKPYIIFVLINDDRNKSLLNSVPFMNNVGIDKRYDDKLALVITGSRKVAVAINEYLSLQHHLDPVNAPVKNKLITKRNKLLQRINSTPLSIPPRGKSNQEYIDETSPSAKQVEKSAHAVKRVIKRHKSQSSVYFFKPEQSSRTISEIEAFNSICYRVLLNERAAKVKSVHDDTGKRVGLVSKEIKSFSSLHDYYRSHSNTFPLQDSLVTAGYGKVLAASYCEEEFDLHGGNIAYDEMAQTVSRIDYDMSTWPLTAKYTRRDPEVFDATLKSKPVDAFPITRNDLVNFPHLSDAKPYNWPDRSDGKKVDLKNIENNTKFKRDKYLVFIKRILINTTIYQNAANATISNENTRRKFVEHKVNRTNELRKQLLQIAEFRSLVLNDPAVMYEVVAEFEIYNSLYKKERANVLKVNIDEIKDSISQLKRDCKEKEEDIKAIVTNALHNIYHPEYESQYHIPIRLFGNTFSSVIDQDENRLKAIMVIKNELTDKGLFESDQQVEDLFNNAYSAWERKVDRNTLMHDSAKVCIDKIIGELVKLNNKVGLFGGESVKFGGATLKLPAGAAKMLRYYQRNRDFVESNSVEILDSLSLMASLSAEHQGHGFFNRRLPETSNFYNWVSAMVKPAVGVHPLSVAPVFSSIPL